MRAMTEQAPAMANIRVPIELLREWTLVAVQSRDCALLGRAMTLASAAGHSLQDVSASLKEKRHCTRVLARNSLHVRVAASPFPCV
jgi:ribulose kinase